MKSFPLLLALILCLASCTEADAPETAYVVLLQSDLNPDDATDQETLNKIWGEGGVFHTLVGETGFSRLKHLYVFTLSDQCNELSEIDPSVLTRGEYNNKKDLSKQLVRARQQHESRNSGLQDILASIDEMKSIRGRFVMDEAIRTIKVIYISDMLHHKGESNTQKGIFDFYSSFSFSQFKNQVKSDTIRFENSDIVLRSLFPDVEFWHVYSLRVPRGTRPEPQPNRTDINDTWRDIFTQLGARSVRQNLPLTAQTIKTIVAD